MSNLQGECRFCGESIYKRDDEGGFYYLVGNYFRDFMFIHDNEKICDKCLKHLEENPRKVEKEEDDN